MKSTGTFSDVAMPFTTTFVFNWLGRHKLADPTRDLHSHALGQLDAIPAGAEVGFRKILPPSPSKFRFLKQPTAPWTFAVNTVSNAIGPLPLLA